jgi:hypothetical protein
MSEFNLLTYGYGCFACIYACVPHACLVLEKGLLEEGLGSPKLELKIAVSCCVGAGNQAGVPGRKKKRKKRPHKALGRQKQ